MNGEEFKKKIVDIIFATGLENDDYTDGERFIVDEKMASELADALIAAGICDAIEYEDKRQERDELEVKCEVLQRDVDNLTRTMEEGREELEEAKHRAEAAETALRHLFKDNSGWWFIDVGCDTARCRDIGCGSDGCIDILVDNAIKRAEIELAEEKEEEKEDV